MTDVLLFHHAHGQTPGFLAFADRLRAAGTRAHPGSLPRAHVLRPRRRRRLRSAGRLRRDHRRGTRAAKSSARDRVCGLLPRCAARARSWRRRGPEPWARCCSLCVPVRRSLVAAWKACRPDPRHGRRTRSSPRTATSYRRRGRSRSRRSVPNSSSTRETSTCCAMTVLPSYDKDAAALMSERVLSFLRARSEVLAADSRVQPRPARGGPLAACPPEIGNQRLDRSGLPRHGEERAGCTP